MNVKHQLSASELWIIIGWAANPLEDGCFVEAAEIDTLEKIREAIREFGTIQMEPETTIEFSIVEFEFIALWAQEQFKDDETPLQNYDLFIEMAGRYWEFAILDLGFISGSAPLWREHEPVVTEVPPRRRGNQRAAYRESLSNPDFKTLSAVGMPERRLWNQLAKRRASGASS